MPVIQIEQDDPKLIAQVHAQIEKMVERVRKMPNTVIVTVAEEFVLGYLAALYQQDLLSDGQWRRLVDEVRAALKGGRGTSNAPYVQ
ncbi:hypothetical protein SAMN05444506_12230 [Pseudomonas syringae]|uniref:Uncharacterized protein n=1 Tax=Pseudomonas syringae pv. apii TaxID=81036 RepID=A0A3M3RQH2_9PSED|nr:MULTISPECIES: hypothetical protein [Pseudomonas syringae group]RMN43593.1 hypothetical protein ALQ59_02344 [Pseudomonas syringae pv. apii]RMN52806.1 hypothetical protein ALQ58_200395 [Pseudomonas syringae pv. apii]RMN98574.1 hypothetical protein ALQ49_00368 [Pseudomonas syringae pv. apii]SDZ49431.1 hypothetical protein SAMN05444506_12230 [Pseudomonas syringae]